jgi:glycosyltransferase involved in cell wall biosynthesis
MALRFSIVVATLNRRVMLLAAIDSIRAQNWPDLEIIVVDGGSGDGTIETLAKHDDIILVPGPDRGVYDAFNKGIARATGDIIGILNSDDIYEAGALSAAASAFAVNPDAQAVCGTAILEAATGTIATFDSADDKSLTSPRTALLGSCIINARFFRREAITAIGTFDLRYRFVADRDWLTRWYEVCMMTVAVPNIVYRYRQHASSLTFDGAGKQRSIIYRELLGLAQHWRSAPAASTKTQHIAMLLEGRCRGRLAITALKHGRLDEVFRLLCLNGRSLSPAPIMAVLNAAIDRGNRQQH